MDDTVLWTPDAKRIADSQIHRFQAWLSQTRDVHTQSYDELHAWSVAEVDTFWESVWEYFAVIGERGHGPVRTGTSVSDTRWFEGARINFAENLLKQAALTPEAEAIVGLHETASRECLTWAQLRDQVGSLSRHLRTLGIGQGDTVSAVLPSLTQTVVALLATASVGAIWSVVNTDFGIDGIRDRFAQIEPTVLITIDVHEFNGSTHDQLERLPELLAALPSVRHHILIDSAAGRDTSAPPAEVVEIVVPSGAVPTGSTDRTTAAGGERTVVSVPYTSIIAEASAPKFDRVAFSHPLWVLYSSGTTGKPKGIVHGHGGIVLEALKANAFQYDVGPGDRTHFAVSTTWVVWNLMVQSMMRGTTIITYSGSPLFERPDRHFAICSDEHAQLFCTGAAILSIVARSGVSPKDLYPLDSLRTIISTGSPLPDETWKWAYENVKDDMLIGSDSGGTDISSGILGSNPLDPIRLGQLQGAYLGVDATSVDESGTPVEGEVGELVIRQAIPSMPVKFWNDPDGTKLFDAYFADLPDLWRQGDWATKVPDQGFVIHGRSDATINRGGIRMGSADICQAVDAVPGVQESMVIGAELTGGGYFMPLFVVPEDGVEVDATLTATIVSTIREHVSPRYVPDEIIAAPALPRTRTGKLLEIPIKKVLQGGDPALVNRTAAAEASIVDWFIDFARAFALRQEGEGEG